MQKNIALECKNVTKSFGSVIANKNCNLTLYSGEVLAVLGENGSGKTTLMNMLAGIYYPDEGQIFVDGKEAVIRSPKDAFSYKIGMIHQHFKLVDVFTAGENIVLGIKDGNKFKLSEVNKKIKELTDKYGFNIDLEKRVCDMSVSEKQTVEIVKVLYRGADILILDEPTAVLTPQEIEKLFNVMRKMRDDGKAIIIITHKLNEVLEISNRVSVLRKGEYVGTIDTAEATEASLTEMMVGEKISLNINRTEPLGDEVRLSLNDVDCFNRDGVKVLDSVTFEARSGEILGIAGISGSGQRELLEAIAGLQKIQQGEVIYNNPKDGKREIINLPQQLLKDELY